MKAIILTSDRGFYVDVHHSEAITFTDSLLGATMYEEKDKKHLSRAIKKLRSYQVPYRKMIMELTEI